MNPIQRSGPAQQPITAAQVIELWGDGPIFPGPGWRLSWPMADESRQRLNAALLSGQIWSALQTNIPNLAHVANPWKRCGEHDGRPQILSLGAIAALANTLLEPARLEIRKPYIPLQQHRFFLVLHSDQHELAGGALRLSAGLVLAGFLGQMGAQIDLPRLLNAVKDLAQKVSACCGHALTTAQLAEASRRGIPTFLIDPSQRLYQLGTGIHGRWISSTSNDHDSAFGVRIACDKSRTHDLLRQLGLKVPRELRLTHNVSDEQLIEAAERIGYPCVIKPNNAEQGRGATANIENKSELLEAAQKAKRYSRDWILIQEHINGSDHRLNVTNGVLRFVIKRSTPTITGDGKSTTTELIQEQNAIRRQLRLKDGLSTEIDASSPEVIAMLRKAAASSLSIPRESQVIQLCRTANISTGGLREELEVEKVHPKVRKQSEMIARTLGLDVCGIDYICENIMEDPNISPGAFIEVNSMPQNSPSRAEAIIDNLFPVANQINIECVVIIANWKKANPIEIQSRLSKVLRAQEQAAISFPKALAPVLLPLLPDQNSPNIHIHDHPREILLHKTIESTIYLTTPEIVTSQGLPAALPTKILSWIDQGGLQQTDQWEEFLRRHCND